MNYNADTGKFHDPFIHQVIVGIIGLIFGPLAGLVYMHHLLRYLLFMPIHALIRYYHEKNRKSINLRLYRKEFRIYLVK